MRHGVRRFARISWGHFSEMHESRLVRSEAIYDDYLVQCAPHLIDGMALLDATLHGQLAMVLHLSQQILFL